MSVFVVTWNLNKEGAAYDTARAKFFAQLTRFEHSYASTLETTAFVATSWDAQDTYEFLAKAIDSNDRIFVSKLHSGCHKGFLDRAQWDWINARL